MFFSGRSPQLPYLSEFLNRLAEDNRAQGTTLGIAGALVGVIGGAMGLVLGLLATVGRLQFSSFGLAATVVGINLGCWLAILVIWLGQRQKNLPNTPERRLRQEAREIGMEMYQVLHRRKLHKALNPVSAELLEESARHWCRVTSALNSPFWTDESLPAHWIAVRDQAMNAANQGMEELLVLLRSSFQPQKQTTISDVLEDALETYVTGPKWGKHTTFPIGYDQARDIAEKLRVIAGEVEVASQNVTRELGQTSLYGSGRALDLALGELRSVQEAEDELRQNLQG